MEYLKMYSGFVHLDFDKLSPDELAEFKAVQRDRKKGEPVNTEEPEKPPFKVVFIPANSSYAKSYSTYNRMKKEQ